MKFYYDTYSGGYSYLATRASYTGFTSHLFSVNITGLSPNNQYFLKVYLYIQSALPGGDTYDTMINKLSD